MTQFFKPGSGLVDVDTAGNGLPVTLSDGTGTALGTTTNPLSTGATVTISTAYTRPADTTAYTAGDALADSTSAPTALVFANAARAAAAGGLIIDAVLIDSASVATKGSFELWLFAGTAAPTATNDNAAFAPTDANLTANFIGVIPFTTAYVGDATSGAGGNAIYRGDVTNIAFKCGAAVTSLWGLVAVRNAYVPVSAEQFTFRLAIAQD